MTKPATPARLLSLRHPLDTSEDAPFLITAGSSELQVGGSLFVGPFASADAERAWAIMERDFAWSGASFIVAVRAVVRNSRGVVVHDVDALRDEAKKVLVEMPFYSNDRFVTHDEWWLMTPDSGGELKVDADGRLPRIDDVHSARRRVEQATERPVVAVCAVISRFWHIHM